MSRTWRGVALVWVALLAGCATRPANPALDCADPATGYCYSTREHYFRDHHNLLILAFSGGGTRAAAFSYGVLEALRRFEIAVPGGATIRGLDEVDVITGVSGGSFTGLAYALYGDKLFDDYVQRFLKRDVQGELLRRLASPANWGPLWGPEWGRKNLRPTTTTRSCSGSDLRQASDGHGPMIVASATDISTGARFDYTQAMLDVICSDLSRARLSRAAASSLAVPVVLSPVTLDNYGGTCGTGSRPGSIGWSIPTIRSGRPPVRCARSSSFAALRTASFDRTFTSSMGASPTTSACAAFWPCLTR